MKRIAIIFCLLAGTAAVQAQTPPATPNANAAPRVSNEPTPLDLNDHTGWQSMFDGSTLKGWDGPLDSWRVENGMITTSSKAESPQGSVYLFWGAGKLKNFEFKVELKLEGEGANSGVQFRATRLGPTEKKNSQWESRGYQADYTFSGSAAGSIIECCMGPRRGVPPRSDRARIGTVVRTALAEGQKPNVVGIIGDPAELKKFVRIGDWNEIYLVVRGNTIMYFINGHLMSILLDDNTKMMNAEGELAIQLEGRGDMKGYFRNLWIRPLP